MKILRKGDPEKAKQKRIFNCTECDCIYVAEKSEYKYVYKKGDDEYYMGECPCCGAVVYTKYKKE